MGWDGISGVQGVGWDIWGSGGGMGYLGLQMGNPLHGMCHTLLGAAGEKGCGFGVVSVTTNSGHCPAVASDGGTEAGTPGGRRRKPSGCWKGGKRVKPFSSSGALRCQLGV